MSQLCILCKEEFTLENSSVKVGRKGLKSLIGISKDRRLNELYK